MRSPRSKARLIALLALFCAGCGPERPPVSPSPAPSAPAAASAVPAASASAQPAAPNVLVLSWDGLDRAVLRELLAANRLPNLAALAAEGSLQELAVSGHATCTKPGHATLLTGLPPAVTGVYDNSRYRPIPPGLTIFERLQDHLGGRDQVRCYMVTGKVAHVGGRGPGEINARRKGKEQAAGRGAHALPPGADEAPAGAAAGEPFFLTRRRLDLFDAAQRTAEETGPAALAALERFAAPRFLGFLHFSDPDHAGHRFGRESPEYRRAAETCDEWLGRVRARLAELGLAGDTLLYVATDHGFDPGGTGHRAAPDCWLVTNDRGVVRGGVQADLPATILDRLGLDLGELDPPLCGRPLTAAGAALPRPSPPAPVLRGKRPRAAARP